MSTLVAIPPASPLLGLMETIEAAGHVVVVSPSGWEVKDAATAAAVQNIINSYAGSASQLSYTKTQKQAALDAAFNANFDLAAFIRGGTATNVTSANVGTFLATITNNYRSLRAQITAAASVAAVNSINLNSGWPNNP